MKKMLFILTTFLVIFFVCNYSNASYVEEGIENFPDSYKPYLYELKRKYPNWNFLALYTELDWNEVIENEYANDANLVPISYSDSWKCMENNLYNVEIDKGWVNASRKAVEYTMDTRNFLNYKRIFQFELLSYDETNDIDGIEKILYGTEFYKNKVSYRDSNGNLINLDEKYSDLILEASEISGVSAYHLASRIRQEIGCFLSHNSISGIFPGYEGYYNFYNIGATSSAEPNGAIRNGLEYAKNGKNASEQTKQKYYIPWNTPQRAITGGAIFIGNSYISIGQYNLYLQKFDVNNAKKTSLFWHQYMTNCLAPYNESNNIYNAYLSNGLIDNDITFVIPIYNNMPSRLSQSPDVNQNEYVNDGGRVYANVSTTLNLRAGPSINYEVVASVQSKEELTRIQKGIQNGERWDRVVLDNGIEGYVFQNYLEKVVKPNIASIELSADKDVLEKGTSENININFEPKDVQDSTIIWKSSNPSILTVSNKGVVKAVSKGEATITAEAKLRRSQK